MTAPLTSDILYIYMFIFPCPSLNMNMRKPRDFLNNFSAVLFQVINIFFSFGAVGNNFDQEQILIYNFIIFNYK